MTTLLFHISLAQWSLHRMIEAGELDPLDFPLFTRDTFGIHAVEYVNRCFGDAPTDDTFTQLKTRCDDAGVTSLLIMIDREGDLGHPDHAERADAVENHYRWIERAAHLGCHSIRVNAKSQGTRDQQRDLVADGVSRLTSFAAQHDLNVLIENHGGLSSKADWLISVIEQVDHPNCGTLPDFGNIFLGDNWSDETQRNDPANWEDRYEGVRRMMPYAKAVSAKSNVFDDDGNEVETDYRRMMQIVTDAGYHGYVGIEYEGVALPEPAGILATKRLLQRVREEIQKSTRQDVRMSTAPADH